MKKQRHFFNLIAVLAILMAALGNPSMAAQAGKGNDELKADPRLLQMAAENPDATFMVIVQKDAKNKDLKDMEVEGEILKGGGRVKQQLDLIISFSAEVTGKEIVKLAGHPKVRWITADAPMVSMGGPGMDTVRDDFLLQTYDGNNGTANWTGNWAEIGESGGTNTTKGSISVRSINRCSAGFCLRISPSPNNAGVNIYRQVDLSGAVVARLSFHRNSELNNSALNIEEVQLQVSADGGGTWSTLRTYSGTAFLGAATDTFDITPYVSANTQIRFIITNGEDAYNFLYIDDIEIEFARPSAYLKAIKADQLGLNGNGITVAVVDSGIAAAHPDFRSSGSTRVIASERFGQNDVVVDLFGHGTHVAGIIAGDGSASGGKHKGVAPRANLINLRVSDRLGQTYESDVVSSLQWVYNNKDTYNIRVVNISMNSTVAQSYHTSPLAAAVEILWFNGIVVVVSAGNNGTGNGPVTLFPPANDPFVITVGATEDKATSSLADDKLAVFSAYGTTFEGFAKPDLVAPGRNLVAPLSQKASTVYETHPLHRVGEEYFRMSGTSMSAPVVSGAVALLLQDEPNLTPDQVKFRLLATASKNWAGYSASQSGAGYLDAYAAVYGTTTQSANTGIVVSNMLTTGSNPVTWGSVGWNSVGWNSVGWNSVGWNSVGWNSVGWNSVGWNTSTWDD